MSSFSNRKVTEKDISQVKKSADIIEKCIISVNKWADKTLNSHFPETHPDANFKWGLKSHHDDPSNPISPYNHYLSCCIVYYLTDRYECYNLLDYGEETSNQLIKDHYRIDINPDIGNISAGGEFSLETNEVWISFIPRKWEKEIKKELESNLRDSDLKNLLVRFPKYFNSVSPAENYGSRSFLGSLSHEYTHYYVSQNSHIRSEILEFVGTEKQDELLEVGHNSEIKIIDEIFGHYIGIAIKGDPDVKQKGYEKGEYLKWGINFLSSYLEGSENRLDKARKMEVDIFQKIARKGQIKGNSERRRPLIFFLEECLDKENKNLIAGLRKIEKSELKIAIRDTENSLNRIKQPEIKNDIERNISKLENICEIEDHILEHLLEKCYKERKYNNFANKELQRIVRSEYKGIEGLRNDIETALTQIKEPKARDPLEKLLSELEYIEKDLQKITR